MSIRLVSGLIMPILELRLSSEGNDGERERDRERMMTMRICMD